MLKKWFGRLGAIHFAAILLDPRVKKTSGLLSDDQKKLGENFIENLVNNIALYFSSTDAVSNAKPTPDEVIFNSVYCPISSHIIRIKFMIQVTRDEEGISEIDIEFYGRSIGDVNEESEMSLYFKEPCVGREVNVLDWWSCATEKFPKMAQVVRVIYSVPASSATSERAFSDSGFTINKRRVRLSGETLDKLLFIKSYFGASKFDDFDSDYC